MEQLTGASARACYQGGQECLASPAKLLCHVNLLLVHSEIMGRHRYVHPYSWHSMLTKYVKENKKKNL